MTEPDPNRLLVLCQLFYPELISTGQTLTELCEQLAVLGVEIEVICGPPTILPGSRPCPRHLIHHGIRIHRVRATRFPKLNLAGRIVNQITFALAVFATLLIRRPRQPILVLTNPPFLALACAMLRALRLIGPYHYLIFDVYPDTAIRSGLLKANGLAARLWDWTNRLAFRYSQSLIVIGRCMADVIARKLAGAGMSRHAPKLARLHIWSDDALIGGALSHPAGNPFPDRWQLHGKFVVGYFGNLGRFHDIQTILDAARQLRHLQDILFLFVGEGHRKAAALDFVARESLANCRFHTYVPRAELGWSLTAASVALVSLQAGQEGLSVPSKAVAMMAAARPILAIMSGQSEIARLVREHDCGRVIAPGDSAALAGAILELYHDRQRAQALGANGLRAVQSELNLPTAARTCFNLFFPHGGTPD